MWQPFHGLAVAENHEGNDAALRTNKLFSVMQSFCEEGGGLLLDPRVAKTWMQRASEDGFTHLILRGVGEERELDEWQCGVRGQDARGRPGAMAASQELRRHMELWLGPPLAESEGDALFVLPVTK